MRRCARRGLARSREKTEMSSHYLPGTTPRFLTSDILENDAEGYTQESPIYEQGQQTWNPPPVEFRPEAWARLLYYLAHEPTLTMDNRKRLMIRFVEDIWRDGEN